MATDEAKLDATAGDAADSGAKETAKQRSAKGILASPIARIGLFVVLLGVNAVVSYVVVQKFIRPRAAATETPVVQDLQPEIPEPGELFLIENLIVNPAGTRATRYLRVGAALEYTGEHGGGKGESKGHGGKESKAVGGVAGELEQRKYQFRDLIISELSSRTVEELMDSRIKEEIREELLSQLNATLREGELSNLYFTEFVIQ